MMTVLAAVLAISISSDKIDTFMHVPDWFPGYVFSWETFGSGDHTNHTHRTSLDTLAAVESVFDAFHERVFFASEGRSNDWDVAVYGPRPTDLQQLWFTNTLERLPERRSFVYSSWTNAWPRATPDSRRLVEFDNVFELSKWMPALFQRSPGRTWLDKGETWGSSRNIMFGSSWGPADNGLPDISWTPNASFRPDLAACCVPLCYCRQDSSINTNAPASDGFLWDVLRKLDENFNALYRIEGGPLPTYAVATNGYLAEWHNSGAWAASEAGKTSVPEIITNHFPLAGPEAGMTNITRRLLPDDLFVAIVTNRYGEIGERSVSKMASECISLEGNVRPGAPGIPEYGVGVSVGINYTSPEYDRVNVFGVAHSSLGDQRLNPSAYFDFGQPPRETDRVEVTVECNGLTISYSKQRPFDGHYVSEVENDAEVSVRMTYLGLVVETNFVAKSSSILATESRALAMLDRTYEIPKCVTYPAPETSLARDEERRFGSSLTANVTSSRTVELSYPTTSLQEPVYLSDLVSSVTPTVTYSTTNLYSPVTYPTVVERRFNGGGVSASGGISITQPALPGAEYIVSNLKALLADMYGAWAHIYGDYIKIRRLEVLDGGPRVEVNVVTEIEELVDYLFNLEISDLMPSAPVTVPIAGNVLITRAASVYIGGVPEMTTFDRMYPWYGPGPYCYSEEAVRSSRVLFAEEVLAFVSRMYGGSPLTEWSTDPIGLPLSSSKSEVDGRPYTWDSWHRLAVSSPSGGVGSGLYARVYDETYNALRAKVDAEFRMLAGDYTSAQTAIPVSLNMANFTAVRLSGFELGLDWEEEIYGDELYFVINGPRPQDVSIFDTNGSELFDDTGLLWIHLNLLPVADGSVVPNYGYAKAPVAVDGRLQPVIVTDWKWKALYKERNNE